MPDTQPKTRWKGPTIQQIADVAGVGSASVDRVLNNRPGVKEKTRERVMNALEKLSFEQVSKTQLTDIRLFCESGAAFNAAMSEASERVDRATPGIQITGHYVTTDELDPIAFARRMEEDGAKADGVFLVAREHPAINRAVRKLVSLGVPTVCVTSDLPSSRRSAYVGNDQYAAGSVAAQLIGQILPNTRNNILLVMSEPFRAQQEREMGFRRVLRSEFPHLKIEERMLSDDRPETTRRNLLGYFETNSLPAAVYNLAGANRGVAMALEESGASETIFVGHELTPHSRALLEKGLMDYVISHDFAGELATAVEWLRRQSEGPVAEPPPSSILIHTRYNCGL